MGIFTQLGIPKKNWLEANVAPAKEITQADSFMYGNGISTVSTLLGTGRRAAKARQLIYEKWAMMESDPLCSSALKILVTSALGGHETTGQMVFIEKTPLAIKDKRLTTIAEEIARDLVPLLNKSAFSLGYTGAAFGDSYARIYSNATGVIDISTDELYRPPLIQPFERGSRTIGYAVYVGDKSYERLDTTQLARLKMPRTQWVPQNGIVQKALRIAVTENDIDQLPILPSMVGGSLLYAAEPAYDDLAASLVGLVGQRWIDSIDEQMVSVNLESMTEAQQRMFITSISEMLKRSKALAEKAVNGGSPIMERIRHIIPVFNEKQITQVSSAGGGQGRNGNISIDDVMVHARRLSGALGVDLTMLGFADQMTGMFGDGGFSRISAQIAEQSRVIRTSLEECFNQIIDIHTLNRYGVVFSANERPVKVNFYGSIAAFESEKQRTRNDSMAAGMQIVQTMQMFKDIGATEEMMANFLSKQMMLDEDEAKLYAAIVKVAAPVAEGGIE